MGMRRIILSSVACLVLLYFSTLFHKRYDCRKKVLNTKCVFSFLLQFLSETFLILRRTERDMVKNEYWFLCKVPIILVRLEWNLNFLDRFSKNTYQFDGNPSCGRPIVPCGRTETDMTKLVVAFRNFADAPSNVSNKSCKFQYVVYVCQVPIFYTIRAFWGKG